MKAANDNLPFKTLDALPLFATDQQIAVAVVGRAKAETWRRRTLPILEARGFPRVDPLHEGRPTALIRKYYDTYLGLNASYVPTGAAEEEDPDSWLQGRRSRASKRRV